MDSRDPAQKQCRLLVLCPRPLALPPLKKFLIHPLGKLGVTVHWCLQNKAPQCLMDYCTRTSDVSSRQRLRSANRHQLMVPRHRRSTFGRRAFSVAGPMEWNSLPHSLRDPDRSTDGFRSALKTHLFAAQSNEKRIRGKA